MSELKCSERIRKRFPLFLNFFLLMMEGDIVNPHFMKPPTLCIVKCSYVCVHLYKDMCKRDENSQLKIINLLINEILSLGLGAAWNVANISKGSTVVIFGLGTVGLSVSVEDISDRPSCNYLRS